MRKFVDFLAKMGLAVRDDPPKVIDFSKRESGDTVENLQLSAEVIRDTDPWSLSVVIRNVGSEPRKLGVPGWLHFYSFRMTDGQGGEVPLSPYGRSALDPSRRPERIETTIPAGEWVETLVPLGSFFNLRMGSGLKVLVTATLESGAQIQSSLLSV